MVPRPSTAVFVTVDGLLRPSIADYGCQRWSSLATNGAQPGFSILYAFKWQLASCAWKQIICDYIRITI